jgi:hypothetical protein
MRLHGLVAVLTVLGLTALVAASWEGAARSAGGQRPRLRWYMAATIPSPAGTRITAAHLQRTVARLPEDSSFVPAPDRVLNTYTAVALGPRDRLIPECVFTVAPVFPRNGKAVVPVHLKKGDVVALQAGMRVAFARDTVYLPKVNPDSGFEILALHSGASPETMTALVAVSRGDAQSQRLLATGDWRAIALHGPPEAERPGFDRLPGACASLLERDRIAADSARVRRDCLVRARQPVPGAGGAAPPVHPRECARAGGDSARAERARVAAARAAQARADSLLARARVDSLRAARVRDSASAARRRPRRP